MKNPFNLTETKILISLCEVLEILNLADAKQTPEGKDLCSNLANQPGCYGDVHNAIEKIVQSVAAKHNFHYKMDCVNWGGWDTRFEDICIDFFIVQKRCALNSAQEQIKALSVNDFEGLDTIAARLLNDNCLEKRDFDEYEASRSYDMSFEDCVWQLITVL